MADKATLVLVPGLICTGELWAPQVVELADVAEVIIVDHSRTETVGELARSILEGVEGRFALAGHSMGGYAAFEILRQAPERVERLALIATCAGLDAPEVKQRRLDFINIAKRGKFRGMSPVLLRSFVHPDRLGDQALIETVYRMAHQTGAEGFINQQKTILSRPDSRPGLGDIQCPSLIICGLDDERTPPHLHEEMAEAIRDSELVTLARCGHLPTLERPTAVTQALAEWLGG